MKKSFSGPISKLHTTKERINVLEDMSTEIIQTETQHTEKKSGGGKQNKAVELYKCNIFGLLEWEERKNESEEIFEKIMAKSFPKIKDSIDTRSFKR